VKENAYLWLVSWFGYRSRKQIYRIETRGL